MAYDFCLKSYAFLVQLLLPIHVKKAQKMSPFVHVGIYPEHCLIQYAT